MPLSCQKAFLLLLASTIACHETTAPQTVSARFVLETVNGRQVPTYLAATPGPTATIFSAGVSLDKSGKAVLTEHRRVDSGGISTETTDTTTYDYRIRGAQIEIGSFFSCPINANCLFPRTATENRIGTIFAGTLSLTINPMSADGKIVYRYRMADSN